MRNIASEAARLTLDPAPMRVATLSNIRTLGHSWRCTGKNFSKAPKSTMRIGCLNLTRAVGDLYSGPDYGTVKNRRTSVKTISAAAVSPLASKKGAACHTICYDHTVCLAEVRTKDRKHTMPDEPSLSILATLGLDPEHDLEAVLQAAADHVWLHASPWQ